MWPFNKIKKIVEKKVEEYDIQTVSVVVYHMDGAIYNITKTGSTREEICPFDYSIEIKVTTGTEILNQVLSRNMIKMDCGIRVPTCNINRILPYKVITNIVKIEV